MHMADALISPAVGGTMWVVTAGLIAWCARKVKQTMNDRLIPMMGVLGAFIFAAQMINFSIPGTGSSGHLGGGLILAALLGPHAAFLVIASVLTVQALFFADGGVLALGCNIFNLGFFPAFIACPFIYRVIVKGASGTPRAWLGAIAAAGAGLLLGAFSVVLETKASGISALPFGAFVLLMLPIHLHWYLYYSLIFVLQHLQIQLQIHMLFWKSPYHYIHQALCCLLPLLYNLFHLFLLLFLILLYILMHFLILHCLLFLPM